MMLVQEVGIVVPVIDPIGCITKVANKAKVSEKSKRMAIDTMKKLVNTEAYTGKRPMSLAATILYLSCLRNDEAVTQKDVAEAAGVTEVTMRNRIKDLKSRNVLPAITDRLFP
jgi:transcription initiation factor TFIIB